MQAPTQITKPSAGRRLWRRIMNHWEFYLLLVPMFVIIFVFKYIPMYGVQIALRISRRVWASWAARGLSR